MREICTSGSMRGQRALLAGLLYSQKGFTQNSQLKTQNAGYASCKENKILVTTGITGYGLAARSASAPARSRNEGPTLRKGSSYENDHVRFCNRYLPSMLRDLFWTGSRAG